MWEPRHLTNLWASTACYTMTLTFFYYPCICLEGLRKTTKKLRIVIVLVEIRTDIYREGHSLNIFLGLSMECKISLSLAGMVDILGYFAAVVQ
jgi:hypothetical protein